MSNVNYCKSIQTTLKRKNVIVTLVEVREAYNSVVSGDSPTQKDRDTIINKLTASKIQLQVANMSADIQPANTEIQLPMEIETADLAVQPETTSLEASIEQPKEEQHTLESLEAPKPQGQLTTQQPNSNAVAAYQTKTEMLLTQLVEETYGEDAKTEADFLIQTIATEAERETAILAAFPLIKDKFISHFWDTKYKAIYETNKTKAQQGREGLTKFFQRRTDNTKDTASKYGINLEEFGISLT